jgi:hypothetical protein
MNRIFLRRIAVLMISALMASSSVFSQLSNVDFLRSAPADGVKFIEAYITPWANAFGAGLNGSWYNTAKPHKFGGFDVTMGVNVGIVPSSAESFDLSTLDLSANLSPKTGTAPTIAGPKTEGPVMTNSQSGVNLASFNSPAGTAWKYIPVPTLQVGIGLPLGTEVKVRYIPRLPIKDGDIMLWGVGLMHSIMQYIPGNALIPVDASIFAGYTKLNGNVPVSLQPKTVDGHMPNYTTYTLGTSFLDQNLSATVEALNVGAIVSVNLPVISFYGGLGYSKTSTIVEMTGNFPTPVLVTPAAAAPYAEYNDSGVKTGDDFPEIDIENFSGLRANIGFRLKMAVVTFHVDYTRAQYNVVSAGLGISFR